MNIQAGINKSFEIEKRNGVQQAPVYFDELREILCAMQLRGDENRIWEAIAKLVGQVARLEEQIKLQNVWNQIGFGQK